jgi:sortase A
VGLIEHFDGPFEDRDRRPPRVRRWVERILITAGVLCLGSFLYAYGEARLYQSFEDQQLDAILQSAPSMETVANRPRRSPPAPGSTIGRVEIPRLGVSAVIRAGSDARTLRLAVGYIPGTALPGENGNMGLAGHRDTFFRKLRNINPDDEIRVTTKDGVYHYYVQRTDIVQPNDVWVLNSTAYPALTLVTCYPFSYIGSAPQRFIVRAMLKPADASTDAVEAGLRLPDTIVSDDSRRLQPQRGLRQDHNGRQPRNGARTTGSIGTAGRSPAGHGRVDLGRRQARRRTSVDIRTAPPPTPAKRRAAKDSRRTEPAGRTWFFFHRRH